VVRVENRDMETLMLGPKPFTQGRELCRNEAVVIEEHQAGELGVQRLHYLYKTLKATSAYDTW